MLLRKVLNKYVAAFCVYIVNVKLLHGLLGSSLNQLLLACL